MAGEYVKCSVCGRKFFQERNAFLNGVGLDGVAHFGAKLTTGKKDVCPECKRAGWSDKRSGSNGFAGSTGGGNDAVQAAKIAAKAAEEERAAQKRAESEARHKAAVQAVKDFQFDESDDESFNRSAVTFIEEYKTCNPGLGEDKDYKKAYKQRIENELKILKTSNDSMYQKLNALYEEAKAEMKARLKKRLIASGILLGVSSIGMAIFFAVYYKEVSMFFAGLGLGIGFPGLFISGIPQIYGHKKSEEE